MSYILNIHKFIGLYNLEYFSTAVLISLIFQNTFDKQTMKWNYVFIIPNDKSYVIFNNNKIYSLQTYDTEQNYRILHKVVQRLSQHNLKMSNHRHIEKLRQRK
jgi:hypothetical protein